MDVSIQTRLDSLPGSAVAVVPYFENDALSDVPEVTRLGAERLASSMECGEIRARPFHSTLFHPEDGCPGLLMIGAGKRDEVEPLMMMRVAAAAARHLTGRGYSRIAMADRGVITPSDFARATVHGMVTGAYDPGLKKTRQKTPRRLDQVSLVCAAGEQATLERGADIGRVVGEAINVARDLVNLPPNDLTPVELARRAEILAADNGIESEILDETRMEAEGMGSLLGVAAGSEQPPRLIVLRYGDPSAPVKLALVGKGLTFDSGGLSLKTAEGMETMKGDMGGAAAVIAGIAAVARLGLRNIFVTAYAGATENMPGGGAMRPGDVLTAINGETIEVLNTDAEGRLVLADVLGYACKQGATHIVDFATLTGGAVVALGTAATLAAGKPAGWVGTVVQAATRGLERAWQMQL